MAVTLRPSVLRRSPVEEAEVRRARVGEGDAGQYGCFGGKDV